MVGSCRYVCKPGLGHPILMTGQRYGQSFTKMADDSAQEDSDNQGHDSSLVCHARVWSEPLQFNWLRAAVSYTMLKPKAIAPLQERSYMLTCN